MAAKDLYEKDFYKILGVDKKATPDEIKKKYRSLARDLHPDKNQGDTALEDKFKAVSEAYDILSDSKKRAEYDEARSMFERGGFRAPTGGQNFQGGDFSDIFGGGNPQDIFANLFGGGGRRGPRKGSDLQTEATITFKESVFGTTLDLKLNTDGNGPQNISARVPAGVNDGAKIRVKGKGAPGEAGPGDLFIELSVKPHATFSRKGENLLLTLPVTFAEAALGADIKVPTLSGDDVTVRQLREHQLVVCFALKVAVSKRVQLLAIYLSLSKCKSHVVLKEKQKKQLRHLQQRLQITISAQSLQ